MKKGALLIFAAAFAVYLHVSAPALAPYRDMGEFVAVCHTLGIAHPPGYPVYALAGKIADKIPFSNHSYRINLVSVASGASSCALLYLILLELGAPLLCAVLACILWLCSSSQGIISVVTEMYAMNVTAGFFMTYLWLLWDRKNEATLIVLLAFLGGLFLGIRADLLLMSPAIILLTFLKIWRENRADFIRVISWSILFSFIGFTVFLFLLIRSNQQPLFNWYRPETFERLWSSLLRKTHGGTLDLLSQSYEPGALFTTDMVIYFNQIIQETLYAGFVLSLVGLSGLWRDKKRVFLFTLLAWAFTGPFFIYKANLPPNPHALAVLEAHFNLSKLFFYIWAGYGLVVIASLITNRGAKIIFSVISVPAAIAALIFSLNGYSKRHNLFGYDYGKNIFKTLPANSILVLKKDVQLFIFWALQSAENARPDVSVVAQGLSGSPWYMQMKEDAHFPVKLEPLKSGEDYVSFMTLNSGKPLFVGWDEDVPSDPRITQTPMGLVRRLDLAGRASNLTSEVNHLADIYVYRGKYHYESQSEFFSSDLIDDYSKAHYARAARSSADPLKRKETLQEWNAAIALHTQNPNPYYRRGFSSYEQGNFEDALKNFNVSDSLYELSSRQTKEYHSLPDVVKGIKLEWAQLLLNKGVVLEKMGRLSESEAAYEKALAVVPEMAQAHYNIAVLYWNRDWDKVVLHLGQALAIDPNHGPSRNFYQKALYAQAMSRKGPVKP